jgi:ribose transport system ATP-binding protein
MPPLLEVRALSKSFPGVRALDDVHLHAAAGEVLAVVGENGAGKSTLMKIVAGVETPDSGEVLFDGRPVHFKSVRDSLAAGIVLIHQELNLAESLSVAANIFLGREITRAGWLDRSAMAAQARGVLDRIGVRVPTSTPVADLAIGQRQLVEIARALSQSARLIIMDEPTSSLSQHETEILFHVIAELKRSGVAVLYISHRLAEVRAVADRVTVLRDGRNAGELAKEQITHDAIVRLMVGREVQQFAARKFAQTPESKPRLEVQGIRLAGGASAPASLAIHPGEIVGMAGLVGAGRTELAEALVGLRPILGGEVRIDGVPIRICSPRDALRAGMLLVPEDRRLHGLIVDDSICSNISLPNLDHLCTAGFIQRSAEASLARTWVDRLRIKTPGIRQLSGNLSGGNQQKVVFAKWLARGPRVLILDEPTRGVDVGARSEIYALIDKLAADGVAVLMISSDLEEILGVSDRVLVMHEGRIAGELPRERLSEEAVMQLATGGG